jgi:hypothetical protein
MASGMRFVKRAVQSDLARFKAYVEFSEAQGIDYRPADADEPQSRERSEQERGEREKRRQERREKTQSS